jgi:hypothetical protein
LTSHTDTRTTLGEIDKIRDVSDRIAGAIQRRDVAVLRTLLAQGFVHRSHGGTASDVEQFLTGIAQIPGEIRFVSLAHVEVDLCGSGAMVTGIQHAQVVVDGQVIDDRRGFVDFFVKHEGDWRIQAAVDLPTPG